MVVVKVRLAAMSLVHGITVLRVTADDGNRTETRDFSRPDATPLSFPASFAIELSRDVVDPLRIEVRGLDAQRAVRGSGVIEALTLRPGRRHEVDLWLACAGVCPVADGGAGGPDTGSSPDAGADAPADCGNGRIDPGETCDIAIAPGQPGACPPATCDDGITCTVDTRSGSACTAECNHAEIRAIVSGDRCCPAGATHDQDPDCSATCGNGVIEPGEVCDTAIRPARPGACPTADDCRDQEPCTTDILVSAGTCSARCLSRPTNAFVAGDNCCPAGASHGTDPDCPVVCGNGVVEPGESCDIGIKTPRTRACPTAGTCRDNDPCTTDRLEGSGCQANCRFVPVTQYLGGDGCCPLGGNGNVDADCAAICGNGVVEPGESCDRGIAADQPGACPTACVPDPSGCVPKALQGKAVDCSGRCVGQPITVCKMGSDGCCPKGCTALNDGDCSPTCGNGVVEPGETCDTALPGEGPGTCPRACDDQAVCTTDALASEGTCSAHCTFIPITAFVTSDGCCPPGGNHNLDGDCPAICGNAAVEPPDESCDDAIPSGDPGACPSSCQPAACQIATLEGTADACTARCQLTPITRCEASDACCPLGCNRNNDADCPVVCGNAVVEMGEACDKGITAGNPGACPASCEDNDLCTADSTSGRVEDCTRTCGHAPVTACAAGDGCCPEGCHEQTDADCAPVCGNSAVESGETCDPPGSCPTTCPDDEDPCTRDTLIGDPAFCTASCTHPPITMCSETSDRCCPTGCTNQSDVDCSADGGI